MRLTNVLARNVVTGDFEKWVPHKLYFGHGRGKHNVWGPRKQNYYWTKKFNYLWRLNAKRPVLLSHEELPPNAVVHDAREVARVQLYHTQPAECKIGTPFPFVAKFTPNAPGDPSYNLQPSLFYNPRSTLYEGVKGANHFTNSIVEEESSPSCLTKIEDGLQIDQNFHDLLRDRLNYAMTGDSSMIPMPKLRVFPELNRAKPREAGIHPLRKHISVLKAFSETSNLLLSSTYGLNQVHQIDWPACLVPFQREGSLCILDLKAEFVTTQRLIAPSALSSSEDSQSSKSDALKLSINQTKPILFCSNSDSTTSKELPVIAPVDWRINFEETNCYPTDYNFSIPEPYHVNSIFLTGNSVNPKPQPDRMVFARGILHCYGYLVAETRRKTGVEKTDENDQKVLSNPQTIQLAFYNPTKSNIGFISFQLNTTSFNSPIKNQVWLDGPYPIEETEFLLKKFVARNLLSQGHVGSTVKP